MTEKNLQKVDHPCAWKRQDLMEDQRWIYRLSASEAAELDAALVMARSQGARAGNISPRTFPLTGLADTLAQISDQLENGRGIALLKGIDVERYGRADLELLYAGIGSHLGTAVAQSREGELVGLVTDTGKKLGEARGTKTRDTLPFHSDRSDVVGLFCLQRAKTGGESYVVSATAIYNAMLEREPELCAALFDTYYHGRTYWEAQTAEAVYPLPIFSFKDGKFAARYLRHFINTAQEDASTPRLSALHLEAINRLETYFKDPEFFASMPFELGDIQFLNNYVAFHSRAGYEDFDEEHKRRLLLRLWLSVPNSRPLVDGFVHLLGAVGAGELRGGVPQPALELQQA